MVQLIDFIGYAWDFYIEGWFHQTGLRFLPDGSIEGDGAEGFHTWQLNDDRLDIYDELGVHTLSLVYVSSATLLKNDAKLRIHNNNVFLVRTRSYQELQQLFQNQDTLCTQIANRVAAYRSPKGEVWNYMFFGIDGQIYHYDHPNERKWKVENGILHITKEDGTTTSQSTLITRHDHAPEWVKTVHLQFTDENYQATHYLDFFTAPHTMAKFFHANMCLSNRSDTLFVSFNSAAGQYNGYYCYKYEFHAIPYIYGVDYIRIAQSPPTRWYLDNFAEIQTLIQLKSYKKVVLVGMSIGGYGALWFAEKLARLNPQTQYYSVATQPQTSLDPEFIYGLKWKCSKVQDKRPKVPHNTILLDLLVQQLDLDAASALNQPLPNLQHHIFYDKGNEMESLCSERMASERTHLHGFDFNVRHGEGCGKIWATGEIQKLLQTILAA